MIIIITYTCSNHPQRGNEDVVHECGKAYEQRQERLFPHGLSFQDQLLVGE